MSSPPIQEPITGREDLDSRPVQVLAQFSRAFHSRDLVSWPCRVIRAFRARHDFDNRRRGQ